MEAYTGEEGKGTKKQAIIDELVEVLQHAHNSLRTFREVPIDEQEWTSLDDDTMLLIEEAIIKAKGELK